MSEDGYPRCVWCYKLLDDEELPVCDTCLDKDEEDEDEWI